MNIDRFSMSMLLKRTKPPAVVKFAARQIVLGGSVVSGTITLENGHIAEVRHDAIPDDAIDWGRDLMLPGLIELHTDHLEPHYTPRPGVSWGALSAVLAYDAQIAASGITTVLDSLRVGGGTNVTTAREAAMLLSHAIAEARTLGLLRADHHTHLRCEICSEDVVEAAADFLSRFDVRLMSLMDHTPGQRQFRDEEKLRQYYRGKQSKSEAELDTFLAKQRSLHDQFALSNRRSLVAMARAKGVVLASHDDTTAAHVAESLDDGVRVAEFPTTLDAAEASHCAGIAVMMGAPNVVRGGSHSGNVSAQCLAEAGYLDILSSDYVPVSLLSGAMQLQNVPSVGGLPGAIRLVSKAPALAAGFTDRGEIAPGLRADLIRVTMAGNTPVVREVYRQGQRIT